MKRCILSLLVGFLTLFSSAQSADLRLLISLNKNNYPVWDNIMWGTSASVYLAMPLAVATPFLDGTLHKNNEMKKAAIKNAAGISLALTTATILKIAVQRERPKAAHPADIIERDHAGALSFPSGHTTSAFSAATAISLTYRKWYVVAPAFLYAGLTGYSRMRLGMHYPTDVLAGALIGSGCTFLVWKLQEKIQKKNSVKIQKELYE